jgi:hypothetical protein
MASFTDKLNAEHNTAAKRTGVGGGIPAAGTAQAASGTGAATGTNGAVSAGTGGTGSLSKVSSGSKLNTSTAAARAAANANPGGTGYSASAAQQANMAEHGYNYTPGMDIKLSGDIAAGDPIFGNAGRDADGNVDPSTAFYKTLPNGWRIDNTFTQGRLKPGDSGWVDTTQGSAWSQDSVQASGGGGGGGRATSPDHFTAGDWTAVYNAMQTGNTAGLTKAQREAYDQYTAKPAAKEAEQGTAKREPVLVGDGKGATYAIQSDKYLDWMKTAQPGDTIRTGDGATITMGENGTLRVVTPSGYVFEENYIPKGGTAAAGSGTGSSAGSGAGTGSGTGTGSGNVQLDAYDLAYLSPEDQKAVLALKQAWYDGRDKGNTAKMEAANREANNIRAKYGYTAGINGINFEMSQPEQMENISLPESQSALGGMQYTPMDQGGDWTRGLAAANPTANLTGYQSLAKVLSPRQMQGMNLGGFQSALNGVGGGQVQQGYGDSLERNYLGDYETALYGLSQAPAGLTDTGAAPADYRSALAGLQYSGPQRAQEQAMGAVNLGNYHSALNGLQTGPGRAAEQALGNVDLGNYQSALNGVQYTPQAGTGSREAELARTVLPQGQGAYGGITAPELAAQGDYSQLQNAALPGYQAQTAAVNQTYDAQQAANLEALRRSYENSRAELEHGLGEIGTAYQQQKNQTAAGSEIARRNFQEQAAASGLNAGNRGQAALAFSTQMQNDLGQLNAAQAKAVSDAQFELSRLQTDYQNQISQAIAQNNYERAAALMQEYQTAQQSRVDTAVQQAGLNLQTAEQNRLIRNDRTDALQQEFSNRLALAQGQQADQQAAADLAYRQAGLDLQTAQYNREGRQLQRDTAQQDFQNQLALAQARDAASQDAWNRAYQQAGLNMDVAAYNREGRSLDYQAAQQDYQNRLALAQAQDAANQDAWNRAYQQAGLNMDIAQYNREGRSLDYQAAQQDYANYLSFLQAQDAANQSAYDRAMERAAFDREGRQLEYDTAMRSYEAELARAQAIDAANQAVWNRAYQQAGLDLDTAQYNRETAAMNNQVSQQNWENRLALAQARDAANQDAYNRALQQANLNMDVAQFNRDSLQNYYQALQQDFTNRLAVNQEARDAQSQAYDQAYRLAQMNMEGWGMNQDVQQRNFENQLALAQAQDAANMDAYNRALQQANLDLSVYDRNRQAQQDMRALQQQVFDNQRTLTGERFQQDQFDWQRQQAELDRQAKQDQTAWDRKQQDWENEFALTELGAELGDTSRFSYYGYTPAQLQQMFRFAQMDKLGKILW